MLFLNAFVLLFASAFASEHPDYCKDDFNCMGFPHIGCNNLLWNGGFGEYCKNASNIENTPEVIRVYLDTINMYRNQQALGKTPNYKPAVRMATVSWDQIMADVASLNARACTFQHDKCRNTAKYNWSGQTISLQLVAINKCYTSDEYYIKHAFAAWFSEAAQNGARYGWMDAIDHFPKYDRDYQIGHFCQLIRDASDAIGCASTKYTMKMNGKTWNAVKITCNYAQIVPFVGHSVYVSGPTASMCKTGRNNQYPGLCSENELYEDVEP